MTKLGKMGLLAGLAAMAMLTSCAPSLPGLSHSDQEPAPLQAAGYQTVMVRYLKSESNQAIDPQPAACPQYYDVPLPQDLQKYIRDVCVECGVSEKLVLAVIEVESGFEPDVISSTNDYGLMQINVCNHEWLSQEIGVTDFLDPKQNIQAGVYMLSALMDKYDDVSHVLIAYNCGEGGAKELWDQGITETAYSRKVLQAMADIEKPG